MEGIRIAGLAFVVSVTTGAVEASPITTNGLVHFWDFDAQNTYESVSGTVLGSEIGASPHYVAHDGGYAFHAQDQNYIRVAIGSMYIPGLDSFSMSVDFRMDSYVSPLSSPQGTGRAEQAPFVTYQGGDAAEAARLGAAALSTGTPDPTGVERLQFAVQPTSPNASTHTRAITPFDQAYLGQWNTLVGVWDRLTATAYLYLNGTQVDATPFLSSSSIDPSWDFLIGAYEYSSARNGHPKVVSADVLLDNVAIYDRALSAREIAAVPEPMSFALTAGGLLALHCRRRRAKRAG